MGDQKSKLKNMIGEDPELTDFQKKVLMVVADIPEGEVKSYGWVAREAGSPRAARAVGQVMAINPYVPDVPCHRVIASDGTIGGYSGGIVKKRALLKKEGRNNSEG
ncbi:MAG: MGMT family protein [Candidatus Tantalella remota]|nr:MGMT family protein [Candidatus Tantalella remota]